MRMLFIACFFATTVLALSTPGWTEDVKIQQLADLLVAKASEKVNRCLPNVTAAGLTYYSAAEPGILSSTDAKIVCFDVQYPFRYSPRIELLSKSDLMGTHFKMQSDDEPWLIYLPLIPDNVKTPEAERHSPAFVSTNDLAAAIRVAQLELANAKAFADEGKKYQNIYIGWPF